MVYILTVAFYVDEKWKQKGNSKTFELKDPVAGNFISLISEYTGDTAASLPEIRFKKRKKMVV